MAVGVLHLLHARQLNPVADVSRLRRHWPTPTAAEHDVEELSPEPRSCQAIQVEVPGEVGATRREEELVDKVMESARVLVLSGVPLKEAVVSHEREGEDDEHGRDDDDGDGGG